MRRIARLFTIKTRFDAFAVTYAVAVGAVGRGVAYLEQFPGIGGMLLFAACVCVVFIVGDFLLEGMRARQGLDKEPG